MQQQQFQKKFMASGESKFGKVPSPEAKDKMALLQQKQPWLKNPQMPTRKTDNGEDMKKSYCNKCESTVGTYKETHDDFLTNLANNAKGEVRKKFYSGIKEDSLLQSVDPNSQFEPQAGQAGFAPQSRVGSIGGGYSQLDFQDLPVLGESKKYPTLAQYRKAKNKNK